MRRAGPFQQRHFCQFPQNRETGAGRVGPAGETGAGGGAAMPPGAMGCGPLPPSASLSLRGGWSLGFWNPPSFGCQRTLLPKVQSGPETGLFQRAEPERAGRGVSFKCKERWRPRLPQLFALCGAGRRRKDSISKTLRFFFLTLKWCLGEEERG